VRGAEGARDAGKDGGKATLRHVAARARVSIGTASNAYNRPDLLSDETRRRVLEAAGELGYAGPDPAARRLRTGRAGAIGLVFTDHLGFAFSDPVSTQFLSGLAEGLAGSQAGLLVIPSSPSDDAATVVRQAAVDGFIVYSTSAGDPRLEAATNRGLPLVVVDQPHGVAAPFVGIDDRTAARSAAEHVRRLGHEQVAVLSFAGTAAPEDVAVYELTEERLAGYREGLGTRVPDILLCRPNEPAVGREVALGLLDSPRPPTAILAMSDQLALGALAAARERGVDVPGRLSIVGFDDSPAAALARPPLTTVRQPSGEKGRRAAVALLQRLAGEERPEPDRVLLDTELVERASTAPPPD
jgi:DNA-binding LacI/PurR family transcriptional regulator